MHDQRVSGSITSCGLSASSFPAPGSPELAEVTRQAVRKTQVAFDDDWGLDHGTWSILKPMFPDADVPMVQLSLDRSLDMAGHLALARRLAPLRDEGVLIVGSGNVVHNLQLFFNPPPAGPGWADPFARRILDAVRAGDDAALTHFPADDALAAQAINSAEHYLPLLYTVGVRLPGDGVALFNDSGAPGLAMACVLLGEASLAEGLVE